MSTQVVMLVLLMVYSVMAVIEHSNENGVAAQKLQYAPIEIPMAAVKRFYSWEDTKRAASLESDELRAKRKQFYAWAGKRSDDGFDTVHPAFEKRKQFYAWAGRK